MTAPDRPRATLVQQHLAAVGLLLATDADLYITTSRSGLNVQIPSSHPNQRDVFRRVLDVARCDVITSMPMNDGSRHLIGDGGEFDGIPVRVYAPLPADTRDEVSR